MPVARQLLRGLHNLFHRPAADQDIADEVDSFVSAAKAEWEARGLTPDEAARAAGIAMGSSTTSMREQVRSYGWENTLDSILQDLRYTLRRLARSPGFTLVSIATLALGLGAAAAIFSVVWGVLLQPLPYPQPQQLVSLWMTAPGVKIADLNMSPSVYFTLRDEGHAFEAVSMYTTGNTTISGRTHPEEVQAVYATHELLPILRVAPELGRTFTNTDDDPDGERTVMLSNAYWRSHFGSSPSVLGRRIVIEGNASSVIGVLPPGFEFLDQKCDVLLPFRFKRSAVRLGNFSFRGIGRIKPGLTIGQASADLARILPLMAQQFPPPPGYTAKMFADARVAPNLRPVSADLVGDIGHTLWLLMATVAIVLLIACANVANLLLVRTDARQQELAVRAALGAGRGRIARQLLFESLLLGITAGAVGLALCQAALKLLATTNLVHLPRAGNIGIHLPVVLFSLLVSIGFSSLFGLIPVLRYARPRIAQSLRSAGRSLSDSREKQRVRSALVVFQTALAVLLLVAAGLMLRTFRNLRAVDPGFRQAAEVEIIRIGIPDEQIKEPERVVRMQQAMLDKIRSVPGVLAASLTSTVPMGGGESSDPVYVAGRTYREGTLAPLRRFEFVAPGYFATLGQRFLAGRDITWAETYHGGRVAIVSANTARDLWGNPTAALGQRIRTRDGDDWREIIGVVADEHADGVDKPAPSMVYWPLLASNFDGDAVAVQRYISFVARTRRAHSLAFEDELRSALWSVDAELPLAQVENLQALYDRSLARTSFTMLLLSIAGSMALILGVVGIYGVISYSVLQRTREIGIRLALGAPPRQVITSFVRSGLLLAVIGCLCGLAAAGLFARWMSSLLFAVSASDPFTYAAMTAGLLLAAALASYFPARRATKVDPIRALRAD